MRFLILFLFLFSTTIHAEENFLNKSKSFLSGLVKKFDNYDKCLLDNIGDDSTNRVILRKKVMSKKV